MKTIITVEFTVVLPEDVAQYDMGLCIDGIKCSELRVRNLNTWETVPDAEVLYYEAVNTKRAD